MAFYSFSNFPCIYRPWSRRAGTPRKAHSQVGLRLFSTTSLYSTGGLGMITWEEGTYQCTYLIDAYTDVNLQPYFDALICFVSQIALPVRAVLHSAPARRGLCRCFPGGTDGAREQRAHRVWRDATLDHRRHCRYNLRW